MLQLRPSCEHCNTALDPLHDDARICSFECTFCARCATSELLGICPNCGGELVTRPRRPPLKLGDFPPSTAVVHKPADLDAHLSNVMDRLRADDLPKQLWAVAFANGRPRDPEGDGYSETAAEMEALAQRQPGFAGVDSARDSDGLGITVSRWTSIAAMVSWRRVASHLQAQQTGRDRWYEWYRSDVARIDRTSEFHRE